ncbi:uncharacterized protein LOC126901557 isoform X2 [Daktulosphaira vitifoliae]|uniref:uncharacterized protein LOC126901557 isoform X2 n=1 Tax=Daktulosphaira vitifoliae TaxID=58002 RepID=UPI0021AA0E62|nr:uncharacterized protein LOC126901557 isoform X2 [Daktulosphaira vitifoliae]
MFNNKFVLLLFVVYISNEFTGVLSDIGRQSLFGKSIMKRLKSLLPNNKVYDNQWCPPGKEKITDSPEEFEKVLMEEAKKLGNCEDCGKPLIQSIKNITKEYFKNGYIDSHELFRFFKTELPITTSWYTVETCDWYIEKYAKENPEKGLNDSEFFFVTIVANLPYDD